MAITVVAVGDTGTAALENAIANQLNVSPISVNGASNLPVTAAGNKIQSGTFTSVFTTANSTTGTLTYPVAFATAPVVIATVQIGANLDVLINWSGSPSATAVGWRLFQKAGTNISGTATVHWFAIGT